MPYLNQKTYLIIGASRGIGLELASQLLDKNQFVIATERVSRPNDNSRSLSSLATAHKNSERLRVLQCDVSKEESIAAFVQSVESLALEGGNVLNGRNGSEKGLIDVIIFNAGILEYPARVSEL